MKKLINDPRSVVREMLEGVAGLTPGVALLAAENVIVRADVPGPAERRVAVISGGGAGHEPAHAGYVGEGMLDAAVAGDVFTSPSVDAVWSAIRAVAGPRGAVLIVKNYTGDRLNFGLAAELARSAGIPTEIVIVADDVSLRDTVPPDRRRGIAGTVLIHKVAGALAAAGASLHQVAAAGRAAATATGTMGVALGACTIPVAGAPGFSLGPEEIEMGLGIHGEKGVSRERIRPADALVDDMLEVILADGALHPTDRVVLLVNNLGGTTLMELAVVARRALHTLRGRGLVVERAWMGTLLSALEMPGCSLSVMKVDDDVLSLLDKATAATAWPAGGKLLNAPNIRADHPDVTDPAEGIASRDAAGPTVRRVALACAAALEAAEPTLTQLDSATGDGDLGISMSRGAAAVRAWCATDTTENAAAVLAGIAGVLRRVIGGSSGPFYAVALLRAARHLAACGGREEAEWQAAFADGTDAIAELGGARAGDRTMLDALLPAAEALGLAIRQNFTAGKCWGLAAHAAEAGAEATAGMLPRLGRASYLGRRALGSRDGGAVAVSIWLRAIADDHA